MLISLKIKNFIIIESGVLEFSSGFSSITGETGSGKSILIKALKLVLGEKASPDIIRSGEAEAELEAVFLIKNEKLIELLSSYGIELEENQIIIRRVISFKGSKNYINDKAITLNLLNKITKDLVSICSQFENHNLFDESHQLQIVDNYRLNPFLSLYDKKYKEYQEHKKNLEEASMLLEEKDKKLDYYIFQKEELDKCSLTEKEDENLEIELTNIDQYKSLYELSKFSEHIFYNEHSSIIGQLESLSSKLSKITSEKIEELKEKVNIAIVTCEDIAETIKKNEKSLKYNPNRRNEIYNRIEQLKKIKKKHGGTLENVFKKKKELEIEIEKLKDIESYYKKAQKKLNECFEELKKIGKSLYEFRMESASELSKEITKQLQELHMKGSLIDIKVIHNPESPSLNGFDSIMFMFTPNKGGKTAKLQEIASGGELSRVTLAIHKTIYDKNDYKTYIFDEVDSGVGGDTGRVIGKKLKEISENNQIVCITHLAQVAVFGSLHFKLEKCLDPEKAFTRIFRINNKEERIQEIARMLSGSVDKKEALDHAKSMLDEI